MLFSIIECTIIVHYNTMSNYSTLNNDIYWWYDNNNISLPCVILSLKSNILYRYT